MTVDELVTWAGRALNTDPETIHRALAGPPGVCEAWGCGERATRVVAVGGGQFGTITFAEVRCDREAVPGRDVGHRHYGQLATWDAAAGWVPAVTG